MEMLFIHISQAINFTDYNVAIYKNKNFLVALRLEKFLPKLKTSPIEKKHHLLLYMNCILTIVLSRRNSS